MDGVTLATEILGKADRIEREKHGQALTADEARCVQAAAFLRKVMGIPETAPAGDHTVRSAKGGSHV